MAIYLNFRCLSTGQELGLKVGVLFLEPDIPHSIAGKEKTTSLRPNAYLTFEIHVTSK